ncbi:hypothetical protein ABT126_33045 [Streptomyces sp. NPDC002012]|uniref:hypothetical protein n=1 Tax=Streptomyces sp. NPDC002012 TaxID=3154532 RepID=UPI0033206B88
MPSLVGAGISLSHIDIVVEDVRTKEELDHRGVEPIDPFGYRIPGRLPRTYAAPVEGVGEVALAAVDLRTQSHLSLSTQPGNETW